MSCSDILSIEFLTFHLSLTSIKKICRRRRELEEKKKSFQKGIYQEIRSLRQQKKQIDNQIRILKTRIGNKTDKIGFCPNEDCGQPIIGEQSNCEACHTPKDSSLQIQSCPSCRVPIERSEGCPQMFCTHCNTGFHWDSMEILSSTDNPHFWENQLEKMQKTQRFREWAPPDREKWTRFTELVEMCRKQARLCKNRGHTEKRKWSNQVFSSCLEDFSREGNKLIDGLKKPDFDAELNMYELMKGLNDRTMEIGDKLKTKAPRIIGWKLVIEEK